MSDITNDRSLTFLLRAPKIYLSKLNIRDIALSYQEQFNLDTKDAVEIAKLTKGYAYAYQLLGDLLYRSGEKTISEEILKNYDMALEDNVYAKIWSSLSKGQKSICYAISSSETREIKELIEITGYSNSMIQVYKKRMSWLASSMTLHVAEWISPFLDSRNSSISKSCSRNDSAVGIS